MDYVDNVFKKNAYKKAIKNLSGVKINSIQDVIAIKGIGVKIKEKIQLNKESNVLLIGCEGDTDAEMYQKLINQWINKWKNINLQMLVIKK